MILFKQIKHQFSLCVFNNVCASDQTINQLSENHGIAATGKYNLGAFAANKEPTQPAFSANKELRFSLFYYFVCFDCL